jgi:hypothetical protein
MTARSHETIRVGLRRIIRDNSVSPKMRMDAIELLLKVEGLMDGEMPKNKPRIARISDTNGNRMRELLELAQDKKTQ